MPGVQVLDHAHGEARPGGQRRQQATKWIEAARGRPNPYDGQQRHDRRSYTPGINPGPHRGRRLLRRHRRILLVFACGYAMVPFARWNEHFHMIEADRLLAIHEEVTRGKAALRER